MLVSKCMAGNTEVIKQEANSLNTSSITMLSAFTDNAVVVGLLHRDTSADEISSYKKYVGLVSTM